MSSKISDIMAELERLRADARASAPGPPGLWQRLHDMRAKTWGARNVEGTGHFVGDETERLVMSNQANGRAQWKSAYRTAELGLEALARGEFESAREFCEMAEDFYADAQRLAEAAGLADLATGAKKPGRKRKPALSRRAVGRPNKMERDQLIADAVEAARSAGYAGGRAIPAAKRDNPDLFDGLQVGGINAAIRRAKKSVTKPQKN